MAKTKTFTTTELLNNYQSLDLMKQRILQIAALAYCIETSQYYYGGGLDYPHSSLHKHLLLQLANDNGGKTISEKEFTLILNYLKAQGFLNEHYRLPRDISFALCKIAASRENFSINMALVNKIDRFSDVPKFHSFYKFNIHDSSSLDFDDYRALNLAIHGNASKIFEHPWDEVAQNKLLTGYRFLFFNCTPDDEWVKSRLSVFQEILCVVNLSYELGYSVQDNNSQREYWLNILTGLPQLREYEKFRLLSLQANQLNLIMTNYSVILEQEASNQWAKNFVIATKNLLDKNNKEALKRYELSIREFSQITNRDMWFCLPEASILYAISLIREQKTDKLMSAIIKRLDKNSQLQTLTYSLYGIYSVLNNDFNQAKNCFNSALKYFTGDRLGSRKVLAYALHIWLGVLVAPSAINWKEVHLYLLRAGELKVFLAEAILAEIALTHGEKFAFAHEVLSNSPYQDLQINGLINVKAEWEYTIDKLALLLLKSDDSAATTAPMKDRRLIWLLDMDKQQVKVLEQILRKNGQWTAGKEVSATRLYKKTDLEYIEHYDNRATFAIEENPYHKGNYIWDFGRAILKLIGHPLVFDATNPDIQIELIAESPILNVKSTKAGYQIKLSYFALEEHVYAEKISATKYHIMEFTSELVQLSGLLGKNGITVPEHAKQRLLDVVCKTTPMVKINADIVDENLATTNAISDCLVQLTPNSDGLTLNILVSPFNNGSYYFPGQGLANQVSLDDKGQAIKLVRNFKAEKKSVEQLLEACPILAVARQSEFEWGYGTLEESLQLLAELHDYKQQSALNIEWPKGETLRLAANISSGNVKIKVKSQQQWFEYDGEVAINDNEVLQLKTLLALLDTDSNSRFVQLDDGKFIALSESLKRQLHELRLMSEGNKVSTLGSGVLEELVDEAAEAKVDKKWQEHLQQIEKRRQFTPVLPTTLQAELRDYQLDGFNYLSRLTNWGIGACLADDMGLGKTVQAIALLVEQAANGVSLVVAPTSVCFNWVEELNKFAPSLNVYLMHNENERLQLTEKLGAMDVLVCSYNLLHQDGAGLNTKEWNLVILDEAQAIKNHSTKRFKAACELNSQRRVILSGTPIENHLGELWSLFRFLNPGLLGSIDKFQKKFITPISNHNQLAKQTLKNLVHPYILRRTKTQVLSELPPKIEQSIYIEPSSEELAFYEAIRQRAMDNLAKLSTAENKRFSILAEITRLRQACCHSSLVDENIKLENSKLAAFLELVQELIENKHKVLVFSQYVRYLEIVQQTLRENDITYQYIDGAVPINQRKAAVAEFQSGKGGDVFLISLKAGGTGLNLTAADYVIILDPWWNPAVEDQAADRAHRMGQQRPVTVYRLIMKNSIEEKIIHMHKDKRDLAGDLLSGQDVGGKLSEDDLLNLMRL